MLSITIIGTGNVATHLFNGFKSADKVKVTQVFNVHPNSLQPFHDEVETLSDWGELKPADIYLVAVSDDVVPHVIRKLSTKKGLVAHTSGSVPLQNSCLNNGVFYPLQTFSKTKDLDLSSVPFCIEADAKRNEEVLIALANSLKAPYYDIDSEQRKSLHLAAVFACNFTNALYVIAQKICEKKNIPFQILYPLIEETAKKIKGNAPKDVQTGPAIRRDQKTIQAHLKQLTSPELKEIYTLLTQLIQAKDG